MKPSAENKKEPIKQRPAIRLITTPKYYFHPDEDFKEDYEWGNNQLALKNDSQDNSKTLPG